jgi:hypothetical protein
MASGLLAELGTIALCASLRPVPMLGFAAAGNRPERFVWEANMLRLPLVLLFVGLSVSAGLAAAEDAASPPASPGNDDGRYSFHRAGDAFVRLDSRTGAVSHCGWGNAGWACKLVPDERSALEGEIGRLQRENVELKKSLLSRGIELPSGVFAEVPPVASAPVPPANVPDTSAREPKMPTDAELDRAFAFMKRVWRRMIDMMVDLQRDIQNEKKS